MSTIVSMPSAETFAEAVAQLTSTREELIGLLRALGEEPCPPPLPPQRLEQLPPEGAAVDALLGHNALLFWQLKTILARRLSQLAGGQLSRAQLNRMLDWVCAEVSEQALMAAPAGLDGLLREALAAEQDSAGD